jgi:PAS domain S-box-containing protein
MKAEHYIPRSISLLVLIPLLFAGLFTVLVAERLLDASLSKYLQDQVYSRLKSASAQAVKICDDNLEEVLSLRLAGEEAMVRTMKKDALSQILKLPGQSPDIHFIVVEEGEVLGCCREGKGGLTGEEYLPECEPVQEGRLQSLEIGGRGAVAHVRYFPFFRWQVAAFAFDEDVYTPLAVARAFLVVSLLLVTAILTGTLLLVFFPLVQRPLSGLIKASGELTEGRYITIETERRDEIGRLIKAFNRLVEGLRSSRRHEEQMLKRIQASERRFRGIIEHASAGYFFMNPEGYYLQVNDAWLALHGFIEPEVVVGRRYAEFLQEGEEKKIRALIDRLETGIGAPHDEVERVNADGGEAFHRLSLAKVYEDDMLVGYEGFIIDTTERKRIERRMEASLKEKQVLLQEIHHRVKNNLNIVVSLLNLQGEHIDSIEGAKRALEVSKNRVYSMAMVHERLYKTENLSRIEMRPYIESVASELIDLYASEKNIKVELEIEELDMDITLAVPIGLILNELISNALFHAFEEKSGGKIEVALVCVQDNGGERYELIVRDNGTGIEKAAPRSESGLGLTLVKLLSEQIGAELNRETAVGTAYRIIIPHS